MDDQTRLAEIRRTTRRRFGFAAVTLVLYFSFVLNWTSASDFLGQRIGDSAITGSLVLFVAIILIGLVLEVIFLRVERNADRQH